MGRTSRCLRYFGHSIALGARYALLLLAVAAFGGEITRFPSLPEGFRVTAVQMDGAGSVYVAGVVVSLDAEPGNLTDAFVAKFAADGTQLYRTLLAGSRDDSAHAIVVGTGGIVYVAGSTLSNNFRTTANSLQPDRGITTGRQAFLAKLSADGQVQSATYFGGGAQTSGSALALDDAGGVLLTGTSSGEGFPVTPGYTGPGNGFFLAKLGSELSTVAFATLAYGGTELTLDGEGNIYTAGAATGRIGQNVPLQTNGDAFQSAAQARVCHGAEIAVFPCDYQFVQKLDPAATELIYATFLTGSFGATPGGIAVDAGGNALVAGTTNSRDYPVTDRALQTLYPASAPPLPGLIGIPEVYPTPATGYITKLNSTGTGLIWSTFFGGSTQDAISDLALTQDGYVILTGQANSHDLPGLFASAPAGCRPAVNQGLGFVARLSPDGASLSPTQLIYGAPSCFYSSCTGNAQRTSSDDFALAPKPDGKVIIAGLNGVIADVELFGSQRLACVIDPADNVQLSAVAPGQILGLFGSGIGPRSAGVPQGGSASSFRGIEVTFDGFAAPILYAARDQINIQAPYEIVGRDSVEVEIFSSGQGRTARKTFSVVPRQPSVFLSTETILSEIPGRFYCGNSAMTTQHGLALNADGTVNSCQNGALPGSTVTIFMNGMGPTQPAQATGVIAEGPPMAIAPGATVPGIVSTTNLPGSISGVAQVQVQVNQPPNEGFVEVFPKVEGIATRQPVVIWVAAR